MAGYGVQCDLNLVTPTGGWGCTLIWLAEGPMVPRPGVHLLFGRAGAQGILGDASLLMDGLEPRGSQD